MMSVENLTSSQTLGQLLQDLSIVSTQDDIKVTGISSDSRTIRAGDLFIAYHHSDVLDYVKSAIDSGASAVILEADQIPDIPKFSVPVIALPQLHAHAGLIAAKFFGNPSHEMNVIGITGTNGKTTVSYLLAQAFNLENRGKSGLIGTLGYGPFDQIVKGPNTTPEAVALQNTFSNMTRHGVDTVAMEVSSHGLQEYRVAGVEFDIAVFTNLSRDHLDYHKSMENYAETKRRLFTDYMIKKAVLNLDDAFGRKLIKEFQHKMEIVAYTLNPAEQYDFPVIAADVISSSAAGMTLEITSPFGNGTLTSDLIGEFNASNLLASLSALCLSGINFTDAVASLSKCSSAPGRMESFQQKDKPIVIVDYAHTPDALNQALQALRYQSTGKLICVFGCGGDRDKGKRSEMGQVVEAIADHIILTNDNPRSESSEEIFKDIVSGLKNKACLTIEADRRKAIETAIRSAKNNDIILIAGKGHEDYQEIAGRRLPFSDRSVVMETLNALDVGNVG